MKAFKFKMDSALSLRIFSRKTAAMALARATVQRAAAAEHLSICRKVLLEAESWLKPGRGVAMTADEFLRRQGSLSYCREHVRIAEEATRKAAIDEDQCCRELLLARQEEEGLLKLKDKAIEAHRMAMIRADEFAMQEFIGARERAAIA